VPNVFGVKRARRCPRTIQNPEAGSKGSKKEERNGAAKCSGRTKMNRGSEERCGRRKEGEKEKEKGKRRGEKV